MLIERLRERMRMQTFVLALSQPSLAKRQVSYSFKICCKKENPLLFCLCNLKKKKKKKKKKKRQAGTSGCVGLGTHLLGCSWPRLPTQPRLSPHIAPCRALAGSGMGSARGPPWAELTAHDGRKDGEWKITLFHKIFRTFLLQTSTTTPNVSGVY